MKKVLLENAKRYLGPNHRDMVSMKLHGTEETGCQSFFVALSNVLPGGGHPFQASPVDQVFYVIEGEVTFRSNEETIVLKASDSLYVAPNELREMMNTTNKVATMLVVKGGGESLLKFI